jgi:glycosyltransferase involved in cell wall biosynthesis
MLNNLKVSVLVLTKNEQQDLPGCLDSVSWSDDIHVYDSMSTDETVSLAKNYGANIVQREFDNWSSHQNWALSNIKFKYDWVFYIDADERMTPSLIESIKVTLSNEPSCVAYNVQRRDFFMGTWLQHVQSTPFYMRLFKPSKVRYERLVNPLSIADGKVGEVSGYLDHFPFSKGLDHWISRHN